MENKPKWVKLWVQKHRDSILSLNREDAGDMLQNMVRYSLGESVEKMSPVCNVVFEYIRQDIDSSVKLYEKRAEIAPRNGVNGGRPPKKEKESEEDHGERASRHKYGEYENVLLSDEELCKLKSDFPDDLVSKKIEDLSGYMKSTGKAYKDHYVTLRNWIRKDMKERGERDGDETGKAAKGTAFNLDEIL